MATSERRAEAWWNEKRERWQINIQKKGVRKTFTSKVKGKRGKFEAERKADEWEPPAAADGAVLTPSMRFWEAYTLHLEDVKARTSEGNYANCESLGRNWLKPRLEHRKLDTITEQDWQNCINDAIGKGRSKKTLKNIRNTISAFTTYCRKNKVKLELPHDVYIPKTAPVKSKTILQPDKLRILFNDSTTKEDGVVKEAWFIHAWRYTVLTGLRRGEVIGDKPGDVVDGYQHIRRTINKFNHVGPPKTPKSRRTFRINKHMQRELDAQKAMLKTHGIISPWLFPAEDGDNVSPGAFYARWHLYCEYHGFNATLKDLRRTLVSIGRVGLTEEQVKNVVGHTKEMDTFGVYGQMIDGEMQEVADTLDRLFSKYLLEPTEEN